MEKDDEDEDVLDDQNNHLYIDDEDLISEEEKTKIHSYRRKNMPYLEDSDEKFVKFDVDVCYRDRDIDEDSDEDSKISVGDYGYVDDQGRLYYDEDPDCYEDDDRW